jgi:carbonic anhydrase
MNTRSIVACVLLSAAVVANAAEHHVHWSYSGEGGPDNWGSLESDFSQCKLGKEQSPIDIKDAAIGHFSPLDFNYKTSRGEVVNNGHSVQVNVADGGSLNLEGVPYKLVQFHFHTPSEEKIDGKSFAMVVHMVHRSADGKLAVVAVLLKEGKADAALGPVFEKMPQTVAEHSKVHVSIDPASILPSDHGYFKFNGSLTTPPCSEGVKWMVLKQPVEVSSAQLSAFRALYPMNARPVQPLNGRKVEQN